MEEYINITLDNIDQDTFNHIIELWKCVRLNNSTIPDDLLDEFKIILLKITVTAIIS